MWKSIVLPVGLCTLLLACGDGGGSSGSGGDDAGGNDGGSTPPSLADTAEGLVFVLNRQPADGESWIIVERDRVLTNAVGDTVDTGAIDRYVVPENTSLEEVGALEFVPGRIVNEAFCIDSLSVTGSTSISLTFDSTTVDTDVYACNSGDYIELGGTAITINLAPLSETNSNLEWPFLGPRLPAVTREENRITGTFLFRATSDVNGIPVIEPYLDFGATTIEAFYFLETGYICAPTMSSRVAVTAALYVDIDATSESVINTLNSGTVTNLVEGAIDADVANHLTSMVVTNCGVN